MAASLANITSVDWSMKLGAIGEVVQGLADVDQCIQIILTTPKGSDPLRPTFGTDLWRYIDYPIDVAIPSAVGEVTQAITQWEPRVKLVSVTTLPGETAGHLSVTVIWRLQLGSAASQTRTTSVQLPGINQP